MVERPDQGWLGYLKGLSLTNVAVLALLILTAGPAWLAWKVVTDQNLAGIIFSTYEERLLTGTDCRVRIASESGGSATYNVTRPYAYSGQDRWYLGVGLEAKPTDIEASSYCAVLGAIIEYARDPEHNPSPVFPHGDTAIFPKTIPIQPGG